MDGAFIERQSITTFHLSNAAFDRMYRVDVTDPKHGFKSGVLQVGLDDSSLELQHLLDEEYAQLMEDRRELREFIFRGSDPQMPHYLPVNLRRTIQNAQQIFHIDRRKPSNLEPTHIILSLRALMDRLVVVRGEDSLSLESQFNATLLFRMHLRATFAARPVLEDFHLDKEAFEWVLGEVETRFNQSIVHPGEMCGTLAAQSIGEPATQMTLSRCTLLGYADRMLTSRHRHLPLRWRVQQERHTRCSSPERNHQRRHQPEDALNDCLLAATHR
jgi:DNA-directed RNA polymerase II subunit RPB1